MDWDNEDEEVAEDLEEVSAEPAAYSPPEEPGVPSMDGCLYDDEGPPLGYSALPMGLETLSLLRADYTAEEADRRFCELQEQRGLVRWDGVYWGMQRWYVRCIRI